MPRYGWQVIQVESDTLLAESGYEFVSAKQAQERGEAVLAMAYWQIPNYEAKYRVDVVNNDRNIPGKGRRTRL